MQRQEFGNNVEGEKGIPKSSSMKLVKYLYVEAGERPPAPRDLNVAFKFSDYNKNGLIEMDEIVHLYELIKQGKVNALEEGILFTGPFFAMKKKKLKNDFKRQVSSRDVSVADIVDAIAGRISNYENSEERTNCILIQDPLMGS